MNLRNAAKKGIKYNIGIDIGSASVGWAVTDLDSNLFSFKGKTTWGSRLFDEANVAADTRSKRGQRRRLQRRRWRLNLLQGIFEEEIKRVDPEFFVRLRQSFLQIEDKTYSAGQHNGIAHPLFPNGAEEKEYYDRFPTIYHLRKHLIQTNEKEDIRLIYLALHNIVKCRGNFLYQDNTGLSAKNVNMTQALNELYGVLEEWCPTQGIEFQVSPEAREAIPQLFEGSDIAPNARLGLEEVYQTSRKSRTDKAKALAGWLEFAFEDDASKKKAKDFSGALAKLLFGLKVDMKKIFLELEEASGESESEKLALGDEERVAEFYNICPDDGIALFEVMQKVYSSYILIGILAEGGEGTLSYRKVEAYNRYKKDLETLKSLVRQYQNDRYNEVFRGELFDGAKGRSSSAYNRYKAKGYTKYNLIHSRNGYDEFKKYVEGLFKGTDAINDDRYKDMMERFDKGSFLRRLKTSDNGCIPYQLHLEEMSEILQKQGQFHQFLQDNKEHIESLVTFRIPYYVGPLTLKNAAKDGHGNPRFAWSVRHAGKENEAIYPWNWDEVIDRKASAQEFMNRLTGVCTYLPAETVVPKQSLLYEEFCLLNELNGAKWSQDGDRWYRFTSELRQEIIKDLFKCKRGKVKYSDIEGWLKRKGHLNPHVRGGQGETNFESKLSSYVFFKELLGTEELDDAQLEMAEEIIRWNTLFQDRGILKETIFEHYGDILNEEQVAKICKKRFTGWGKLSKRLLTGLKADTNQGRKSIMDILRDGNPNVDHRSATMIFQEIIRDKDLRFEQLIDEANKEFLESIGEINLNDLPGSPAVRRAINQTQRIVEEIVSIAGGAPEHIFIEVTRDGRGDKKGKRTNTRQKALIQAVKNLKSEFNDFYSDAVGQELENEKDLSSERLMLYFMQHGRCLYTGTELNLKNLASYQVDHILPQSYIVDDSLDNKALVCATANQRKSDSLLLDEGIIKKMSGFWGALYKSGLISEKKYRNLTRRKITDSQLKGFVARQIVETSQAIKLVRLLFEKKYPSSRVLSVKAAYTSDLRKQLNLRKCRELNDYHHAHDAYLACELGQFVVMRHEGLYSNPIGYSHAVKRFLQNRMKYALANNQSLNTKGMPGSSSFIVSSFFTSGFDKETGEITQDNWDHEKARMRIEKSLSRNDCFISRMPVEDTGAFWDATIYSPRHPKNSPVLALKKELPPERYGGYSREQFAYFCVYEAQREVKGKMEMCLEYIGVPISIAASLKSGQEALTQYLKGDAESKCLSFTRLVRDKIYKDQLIEIKGERFYIRGNKQINNATQISLTGAMYDLFVDMAQEPPLELSDSDYEKLFLEIRRKFNLHGKRLSQQLHLDSEELREAFNGVLSAEKRRVLQELVLILNGKKNMVDLSTVGRSKAVGNMLITPKKEMMDPANAFTFIDQSVTGMFERRTRI